MDRAKLCQTISQWNMNRLDLFEISQPNEVCPLHVIFLVRHFMERQVVLPAPSRSSLTCPCCLFLPFLKEEREEGPVEPLPPQNNEAVLS